MVFSQQDFNKIDAYSYKYDNILYIKNTKSIYLIKKRY